MKSYPGSSPLLNYHEISNVAIILIENAAGLRTEAVHLTVDITL